LVDLRRTEKAGLDALRDELHQRDYLPILFDLDKPASRTTEEAVTLFARMAWFVIAMPKRPAAIRHILLFIGWLAGRVSGPYGNGGYKPQPRVR
jgi:hypothetical protein